MDMERKRNDGQNFANEHLMQPKQIKDIKQFLEIARRKDAKCTLFCIQIKVRNVNRNRCP